MKVSEEKLNLFLIELVHHLSEPLAPALGYLQLLQKSLGENLSINDRVFLTNSIHGLSRLRDAVQQLSELIDTPEIHQEELSIEQFEVAALIDEIYKERIERCLESRLKIIIENDQPEQILETNLELFKKSLELILDFCLDHSISGGEIFIKAFSSKNNFTLNIFDASNLFDQEITEALLKSTNKNLHFVEKFHTAIGINIILGQKLLNLLGGKLKVSVKNDEVEWEHQLKGMEFIVKIPLKPKKN